MPAHVTARPSFSPRPRQAAFTLAELLVVVGIIALLISILVPVVARVRITGQTADTAAFIRALDAACQTYYTDHQAWPGPLANAQMGYDPGVPQLIDSGIPVGGAAGDGFNRPAGNLTGVTGTENLVLGLLGGLVPDPGTLEIYYDPAAVGRGPVKLNPARSPGGYSPYFDARDTDLSMHAIGDPEAQFNLSTATGEKWGRYVEDASAALDSIVPEFLDRYSDRLPILYMRAAPTRRITPDEIGATEGRIIATDTDTDQGVYDQRHIAGYVGDTGIGTASLGAGKSPANSYFMNGSVVSPQPSPLYHGLQMFDLLVVPNDATAPDVLRASLSTGNASYTYPYDIRAYLLSPNEAGARQGDRYVIISAGPDRVYGTEDDVTNYGGVR